MLISALNVFQNETKIDSSFVKINDNIINIQLADSPEKWSRGLMFISELPENEGMLFIFPDEVHRNFWMRNTLIPLDILFISSDKTIIDIATLQPCEQDLCQSYRSKEPATFVLEVNAGYTEKNNIEIGDKIEI